MAVQVITAVSQKIFDFGARVFNAKQAYVSSIRHCQNILFSYRGTEYLDPALELMAENYAALGLPVPAGHTASVAKASFSGR